MRLFQKGVLVYLEEQSDAEPSSLLQLLISNHSHHLYHQTSTSQEVNPSNQTNPTNSANTTREFPFSCNISLFLELNNAQASSLD